MSKPRQSKSRQWLLFILLASLSFLIPGVLSAEDAPSQPAGDPPPQYQGTDGLPTSTPDSPSTPSDGDADSDIDEWESDIINQQTVECTLGRVLSALRLPTAGLCPDDPEAEERDSGSR